MVANQITSCIGANVLVVSPQVCTSLFHTTWLRIENPAASIAMRQVSCTSQRLKHTRQPGDRQMRHASRSHQMNGPSSFATVAPVHDLYPMP